MRTRTCPYTSCSFRATGSPRPRSSTACRTIPRCCRRFIWQKFDLAPDFPELRKFLEFWSRNIEGKLHSVNVKQSSRTAPNRVRHVKHQLTLH